tara:strand:+ start:18373 stop:18810 length:438 start_codon:yes stop_codon:yes gene_type:complete
MKADNVIINSEDIFILDETIIESLKSLAMKHPLKRSRICLHENIKSSVHEMIIVAHQDGVIPPHKHPPHKPESYHIIEGELKVTIFKDDGSIQNEFFLGGLSQPRMYRIIGNIWHQPIPVSEWVVYHEVATGPFEKDDDVIYLNQ